jgi:hypothetical protein
MVIYIVKVNYNRLLVFRCSVRRGFLAFGSNRTIILGLRGKKRWTTPSYAMEKTQCRIPHAKANLSPHDGSSLKLRLLNI